MNATPSSRGKKESRTVWRKRAAENVWRCPLLRYSILVVLLLSAGPEASGGRAQQPASQPTLEKSPTPVGGRTETTEDYNRRLEQLRQMLEKDAGGGANPAGAEEYRIGAEDLLEITVFETSELNRTL